MNKFSNNNENNMFSVATIFLWGCFFVFVVSLFSCGCGVDKTKINIPNEPWVFKSSEEVITYWEGHGVQFEFVEEGGLEISTKDLSDRDALGLYFNGQIYLDPSLDLKEEKREDEDILIEMEYSLEQRDLFYKNIEKHSKMCVISHELGHAMGMDHTENGAHLMAPILSICNIFEKSEEDICCWSEEDEQELAGVQIEEEN